MFKLRVFSHFLGYKDLSLDLFEIWKIWTLLSKIIIVINCYYCKGRGVRLLFNNYNFDA